MKTFIQYGRRILLKIEREKKNALLSAKNITKIAFLLKIFILRREKVCQHLVLLTTLSFFFLSFYQKQTIISICRKC